MCDLLRSVLRVKALDVRIPELRCDHRLPEKTVLSTFVVPQVASDVDAAQSEKNKDRGRGEDC